MLSRYTVVVDGEVGEKLLFNTSTGAFAVVSGGDISQYGDELAEAGFSTDLEPEEELAFQQALFDRSRTSRKTLTLSFVPTYACNYRCPYCYELGHNKIAGKMGDRTIAAIFRFVEHLYSLNPFERLSVQWYGGDPSLALDVVEELSDELIAWCEKRGVAYDAFMISNANLIDEQAARLIADCRVGHVALTIDGPEEYHNRRRIAANGSNSYERNIAAARFLRAAGVQVSAGMNADKVTMPLYADLRDKLLREEGIELGLNQLNDYGCFFGEPPFAPPDFDLYTHEEFAHAQFEQFARSPYDAGKLRGMLSACDHFCTGQLENYFVIDLLGDVYNCDGWVGDSGHVRFSLFDDPSTWRLDDVSHDATRDEQCSACNLLPICQGSCAWERVCAAPSEGGVKPCHPLKETLADYLRLYRGCFDVRDEGFMRLA